MDLYERKKRIVASFTFSWEIIDENDEDVHVQGRNFDASKEENGDSRVTKRFRLKGRKGQ